MQDTDDLSTDRTTGPHVESGSVVRIPLQHAAAHDRLVEPEQERPLNVVPLRPRPSSPASTPAVLRHADWTARHLRRFVGIGLLLVAVAGTLVLGVRYYGTRGSDELADLVVGLGVVVALWGVLLVSVPQMVTLRGAVLTIWSRRDDEAFDLADPRQGLEVTGLPGSATWALVLHREDGTARVLRRTDVDSVALDEVVRQHLAHR